VRDAAFFSSSLRARLRLSLVALVKSAQYFWGAVRGAIVREDDFERDGFVQRGSMAKRLGISRAMLNRLAALAALFLRSSLVARTVSIAVT